MAPDELFTREEVLRGLPAGRARTLLFLIERHTAHLAAESEQLTELLPMEGAVRERDLAFLQAFALGRQPTVPLTIQDLERYAPQWAHLAPENPQLRAGVAHLLGQKYAFTSRAVPGIRAALRLDQHAVQHAYHQLYGKRLETIYAPRVTFADRLRCGKTCVRGSGRPSALLLADNRQQRMFGSSIPTESNTSKVPPA